MIAYMTFEKSLVSMDTLFKGYYIGLIIPSLPFFCIGMFLKEIRWEPKNIESAKFIVPLVIMFLLVPLTNNYCDIYNGNYGYSYLIAVVVATLFTLLLSWLASKLPPSRFKALPDVFARVLGTLTAIINSVFNCAFYDLISAPVFRLAAVT